MVAEAQPKRYTPSEYLALERQAERRSEFINGEIVAISGATRHHCRITMSVLALLVSRLRGQPCEPFGPDMRVGVAVSGHYYYPDVSVACDPQFEDSGLDTLANPKVIVEVLSPSTEANDRGGKFGHHRRLESLQDYVLIAPDRPLVEVFSRRGEQWLLTAYSGLDAVAEVPSIGADLSLRDIYERVEWPSEPPL